MPRPLATLAADLRQRARLAGPPFVVLDIIERCFPDVMVTGSTLPPGVDAMASRRGGPTIVYDRRLSNPEVRFAIAHALARLVTGLDESGADAFAAELLAPVNEVEARLTLRPPHATPQDEDEQALYRDLIDALALRFCVTTQVIESQIRELETSA